LLALFAKNIALMKELAFFLSWIINGMIFYYFELKDHHDMEDEYCSEYVSHSADMDHCLNQISYIERVKYTGNKTTFHVLGII